MRTVDDSTVIHISKGNLYPEKAILMLQYSYIARIKQLSTLTYHQTTEQRYVSAHQHRNRAIFRRI